MKITGEAVLESSPEQLWAAFNDPAVLVRTIPGCQRLEVDGEDRYTMTLNAGVAAITGTYDGRVRLENKVEPSSLRMVASGSGGPGTIEVTVDVQVEPDGEGARVAYVADAVVGGMIGGVSQRMLGTVGKRLAAEFFANLDADIRQGGPGGTSPGMAAGDTTAGAGTGAGGPSTSATGPGAGAGAPTPPAAGTVFERPAAAAGAGVSPDLLKGALGGAALVLAGVLVGGLLGRRRGPSA